MHELIDSGTLPPQETIYPKIDNDPQLGTINYVLIHKALMLNQDRLAAHSAGV